MDREHILAEIRRAAEVNAGKPLGRMRFEAETGIRESDWLGIHWARWGDAVQEAGFAPNALQGRYSDDELLAPLVTVIRRIRRIPTDSELRMERRSNATFPSASVYERFGPKPTWAARIADYCRERPDDADVLALVEPLIVEPEDQAAENGNDEPEIGFVYLLRSGRNFKIGRTVSIDRRTRDLAIQLPEPAIRVHVIRTDDPVGIEAYWHRRFADRRKNGEWFELTAADVRAFKRRRFQ